MRKEKQTNTDRDRHTHKKPTLETIDYGWTLHNSTRLVLFFCNFKFNFLSVQCAKESKHKIEAKSAEAIFFLSNRRKQHLNMVHYRTHGKEIHLK